MSAVRYARQRECAHPTDPPDPRSANERVQQAMARTTSTSLPACIANRDILFWHCSLRCGRARHCTHAAALARQMVMAEVQRPSACQRGRIWRPVAPSGQSGGGRRRGTTPFGRAKGRPPEERRVSRCRTWWRREHHNLSLDGRLESKLLNTALQQFQHKSWTELLTTDFIV